MLYSTEGLYRGVAKYYDEIYHWKNYRKEARKIAQLIRKHERAPSRTLLDVACGTGEHLRYLHRNFDCVGIDASKQMLEVAKRKVKGVEFVEGNMPDFDLGKEFDVVLCLFSSTGHLKTRKGISKAIKNFARHLTKNGVLIIEPWIQKTDWKGDGTVHMQTYDGDSLKIARINTGRAKGHFSVFDERYLIGEKGKQIAYVKDRLRLRFFEPEATLELMQEAGLEGQFTKDSLTPGRSLLIATK